MAPLRNRNGALQGTQIDETRFDITRAVGPDLVQGGRSQSLHGKASDADWYPEYWKPSEVVTP